MLSLSNYVTTYAYEFNDENAPPAQSAFGGFLTFPLGAYHSAEIQYLFNGDFFGLGELPLSPPQEALSATMVGYWTQFAANGNPNFTGAPNWPTYSSGTDEFQSLVPPTPVTEPTGAFDAAHFCALWNAI